MVVMTKNSMASDSDSSSNTYNYNSNNRTSQLWLYLLEHHVLIHLCFFLAGILAILWKSMDLSLSVQSSWFFTFENKKRGE